MRNTLSSQDLEAVLGGQAGGAAHLRNRDRLQSVQNIASESILVVRPGISRFHIRAASRFFE
jgi:hypothetical protein